MPSTTWPTVSTVGLDAAAGEPVLDVLAEVLQRVGHVVGVDVGVDGGLGRGVAVVLALAVSPGPLGSLWLVVSSGSF